MISRIFLALALSLGTAQLTAQPAQDGAGPSQAPEPVGGDSEPASAAPDSQPRAGERAPADYRPSEQISEDLSVSFPVDI